jgi:hypothetical protein
MTDIC